MKPYVMRGNQERKIITSKEFNIDNGSGTTDDWVLFCPNVAYRILSAKVIYTEATDTAGAASANVKLGTAAGGAQIVAAAALGASKAVGATTELTLVAGGEQQVADQAVFVRHTGIAATEAGKYYVQVEWTPIP